MTTARANQATALTGRLDQWQSGKLGTGSRVWSFPRAFPSSTDVPVLLLSQPIIVNLPLFRCFIILRDAVVVSSINCMTSLFGGFPIFSVIGFMAHTLKKDVSEVVSSGKKKQSRHDCLGTPEFSKFVRDQMFFSFVVLIFVFVSVPLCSLFRVLVHNDNLQHRGNMQKTSPTGADLGGGCRGYAPPPPPPR